MIFLDEPDLIGPQGIQRLCKDLLLDPEDVSFDFETIFWLLNYHNQQMYFYVILSFR